MLNRKIRIRKKLKHRFSKKRYNKHLLKLLDPIRKDKPPPMFSLAEWLRITGG